METIEYKLKSNPGESIKVPAECYSKIEGIVGYISSKPKRVLSYEDRENYHTFIDYAYVNGELNPRVINIMDKFYSENETHKETISDAKDSLFLYLCSNYLIKNYSEDKDAMELNKKILEKATYIDVTFSLSESLGHVYNDDMIGKIHI